MIFALLPSFGLANAAATMVGQSLGAENPTVPNPRCGGPGSTTRSSWARWACSSSCSRRRWCGSSRPIAGVAHYAVASLRTIAFGFLFYAYGMVLTQAFNGAGDTRTPTWINLGIFWVLEIPLAWVLAHTFGLGPEGAFLAATIAFCLLAVVSAVLFRRGAWKVRVV